MALIKSNWVSLKNETGRTQVIDIDMNFNEQNRFLVSKNGINFLDMISCLIIPSRFSRPASDYEVMVTSLVNPSTV